MNLKLVDGGNNMGVTADLTNAVPQRRYDRIT